jgi:hypothetical protein
MQMYKDLEKQLHQERAERKKEEENLFQTNKIEIICFNRYQKTIMNNNDHVRKRKLDDSSESESSLSPHFFRTPKINTK